MAWANHTYPQNISQLELYDPQKVIHIVNVLGARAKPSTFVYRAE